MKKKIVVCATGASGILYLDTLLHHLQHRTDVEVHVVLSEAFNITYQYEKEQTSSLLAGISRVFNVYPDSDIAAPPASGSWGADCVIVCPCSMKTLALIANGMSGSLITRAADVMLKERKKLILAVRETPYSRVHLKNMLEVNDAGGIIAPLSPGLYHNPSSLREMASHKSGRLLDLIGIDADINRWCKS